MTKKRKIKIKTKLSWLEKNKHGVNVERKNE